jgi:hypothetical protein
MPMVFRQKSDIDPSWEFADLWDLAVRAHSNLSHTPENSAYVIIKDYSETYSNTIAGLPPEYHAEFKAKFRSKLTDYIHAKSRCASAFITGPARFPVERMRRRSETADKRASELHSWLQWFQQKVKQDQRRAMTPDERNEELWKPLERDIRSSAATIVLIDKGQTHYTRSLFVSSIAGKIERLANNGNKYLVSKCLQLIRELNAAQEKPVISSRHSIWKLEEKAQDKEFETEQRSQIPPEEQQGVDGKRGIINYQEERLQLIFKDKEQALKHRDKGYLNAWNWSPRNQAWQRKITANALNDMDRILSAILEP